MALYLPWITLFIGVLVGCLLTWLIMTGDKRDLQARVTELENSVRLRDTELAACRELIAEIAALEARMEVLNRDLAARMSEIELLGSELAAVEQELETCAAEIAAMREEEQTLDLPGHTLTAANLQEVDDFTRITGIGPAYAARLTGAGIYRYADLAAADPAELPAALGIQPWQKVEPEVWVSEAALLAGRPVQVQIGDDLTLLEGVGPTYALRLRAAGISTFERLAKTSEETLAETIGAPAWRDVRYGDWIAQARLAAAGDRAGLEELQAALFRRPNDNLELIAGVGAQSSAVLVVGGIDTYAKLAAASPETLAALFAAADQRAGDFEAWIAEAKLRAAGKRVRRTRVRPSSPQDTEIRSCPQDLEQIEGIGSVYEQRLYKAGVGTYWEAGMLEPEVLSEILQVQEFQDVDLQAILSSALEVAEKSNTTGHVWDGTEPDDFEPLEGIGPVMERRLYSAGVCTFAALANLSVTELEQICHAPSFLKVDYSRWIAQAKDMVA